MSYRTSSTLAFAIGLAACAGRPSSWDAPISSQGQSYSLSHAVVVIDDGLHRAAVLTVASGQSLTTNFLPVGHGVTNVTSSSDGERLFVLSEGDAQTSSGTGQPPMLTVISFDPQTFQPSEVTYPFSSPLNSLAIDPSGQWAVAYAASSSNTYARQTSFIEDPNELLFFDLSRPSGSAPLPFELRSYGGSPARLTFTPELPSLPGGPSRLLVVEATSSDVHLIDLAHVADPKPRAEVVIPLTSAQNSATITPQGLAIAPADSTGYPKMALRTTDRNVFSWQLGPTSSTATDANPFEPSINETDVGGVPSDIAFVQTDAGMRLAAIVPGTSSAALVDPNTMLTTFVALPASFSHISLVTGSVGAGGGSSDGGAGGTAAGSDVALLWGSNASGVALWSLGVSVDRSYDSTVFINVGSNVTAVEDVPAPNQTLKLLEISSGTEFFVLDLLRQTAAPLNASSSATLSISPDDGDRVWAFAAGQTSLASIDLLTRQFTPLVTVLPVSAAYEIARAQPSTQNAGRALLTVSNSGALGVTVFDAVHPASSAAQRYAGLFMEGQ